MRCALLLALLLLPTATAVAGDVEVKIPRDLPVAEFLDLAGKSMGGTFLYSSEVDGTVGGPFTLTVPRERFDDVVRFILGLRDIETRSFPAGDMGSLTVLPPKLATTAKFRASGLDRELEFDRPPSSWRRSSDTAGSLSQASVDALLEDLEAGKPEAAILLGCCGPRTPQLAAALATALKSGNALLKKKAATALGRLGHAARAELEALKAVANDDDLKDLVPKVIETIENAVSPELLNPQAAKAKAPEKFKVRFETTKGDFEVAVTRAWSPLGADRFYNMVKLGYFRDVSFFRVVKGFVAQFGVHGDPRVNAAWRGATIKDDPRVQSNRRGTIVFAKGNRPHSRSVQFFINLKDNNAGRTNLDGMGFSPFGEVVGDGMKVIEKLYAGYGDGPPYGRGPNQQRLQFEGNEYLKKSFSELDYLKRAVLVKDK